MERKAKLLIIDDEDIVLKSCRRILNETNYEIDTATSGTDGLEQMELKDYDVVITDLKMPGISGIDVLRTIKKNKPNTLVIIFTGYASVESAREALKLGAFDYIPKPFTPEEFRDVVENAVNARGNSAQAKMLDLMAIVSHELKSPVSVVHTTAETLHKGYFGKLDPGQETVLETIIRNCQYLEDIIRNYIDLSKMELDDLKSFKKEIDLVDEVVEPVLNIPEYHNNIKGMRIVTHYRIKPIVSGDPNLLKIVISNLVNNAIKYGYEKTPIEINVYEEGNTIITSILNRGVGISEYDIKNKLFKRFSRLRQEGTEGAKGSGLGLYICKKIIAMHNGKIWAESVLGEWTRFSFNIPR